MKETQKREKLEDVKEIVKPPLDEEFKGVKEILVGRKHGLYVTQFFFFFFKN